MDSYSYSGMECKALGWPKIIDNLANIAQKMVQSEFNSALVNYYPDGKNYLSAHNDKDAMSSIIASFSFGAERTFRIRDIKTKKIVQDIELKNGSLLIMLSGMQQKYLHEVPKRLKVTDGRINVTLRQQY